MQSNIDPSMSSRYQMAFSPDTIWKAILKPATHIMIYSRVHKPSGTILIIPLILNHSKSRYDLESLLKPARIIIHNHQSF